MNWRGLINYSELVAFILLLLGRSFSTVGVIYSDVKSNIEDTFPQILILNSSAATSNSMQCKRLWSASIQNFMTCCSIPTKNTLKCLPSFIIAGVQKGGTTALSALLCTVNAVSFSKKKEVHFFDNSRRYSGGITEYFKQFHEWDSAATNWLNPPVFGESTPFYIASRDACRRISETIPDVKIIVLLREPVLRAHSEYEMKKRRVVAQDEFIRIATKHSRRFRDCLRAYAGKWRKIADCLPEELTSHSHYDKLVAALRAKTRLKLSLRSDETPKLLRRNQERETLSTIDSGNYTRATKKTRKRLSHTKDRKLMKRILKLPLSPRNPGQCAYASTCMNPVSLSLTPSNKFNTCEAPSMHSYLDKSLCSVLPGRRDSEEEAAGSLWVRTLLGRLASERLPPRGVSFGSEIRDWRRCAGRLVGEGMTLQSLDEAVEKCLEGSGGIRMGISKHFFYRSLYAVQLHHCFKYIPRDRFLIISSESLQERQTETFEKVLRFLGLPIPKELKPLVRETDRYGPLPKKRSAGPGNKLAAGNWSEALMHGISQQDFIGAAVGKYFPSFESSSGWQLTSSYDPLPSALELELKEFYKPYNELLYRLLDTRQFEADWSAGKSAYQNVTIAT